MDKENIMETRIGLVGLAASGKTTMLSALQKAMHSNGWDMHWVDDETRSRFLNNYNELLQGNYPPGTDLPEKHNYRFYTRQAAKGGWIPEFLSKRKPEFEMQILDVSGQRYKALDQDIFGEQEEEEEEKDIFKQLAQCEGILFLIDPQITPQDLLEEEDPVHLAAVLMHAFGEIENHRSKPELFVAFCLTKMDLMPQHWYKPEEYARTDLFEDFGTICSEIDSFCNPRNGIFHRWFSCSSVGFVGDEIVQGESRHQTDENGASIQDAGNLKPIGIAEPFEWLLTEIGKNKIRVGHSRRKFLNRFQKTVGALDEV